jgi:hypothetical protein
MLGQTYRRFEVVVCDDGSSDDRCAVIEGYVTRDQGIRLLRKESGGVRSALEHLWTPVRTGALESRETSPRHRRTGGQDGGRLRGSYLARQLEPSVRGGVDVPGQ